MFLSSDNFLVCTDSNVLYQMYIAVLYQSTAMYVLGTYLGMYRDIY